MILLEMLKAIEGAVPPPPNCHHAITRAQYGSDAEGWTDKLALQINRNGKFYCFFLESDDFARDPQEFADHIARVLDSPEERDKMQPGVSFGRYI